MLFDVFISLLILSHQKLWLMIWISYLLFSLQNHEDVQIDLNSCDNEYSSISDGDYDDTDIEEDDDKIRTRENALTMNKMAELKRQLQNLSMTRKFKQVIT